MSFPPGPPIPPGMGVPPPRFQAPPPGAPPPPFNPYQLPIAPMNMMHPPMPPQFNPIGQFPPPHFGMNALPSNQLPPPMFPMANGAAHHQIPYPMGGGVPPMPLPMPPMPPMHMPMNMNIPIPLAPSVSSTARAPISDLITPKIPIIATGLGGGNVPAIIPQPPPLRPPVVSVTTIPLYKYAMHVYIGKIPTTIEDSFLQKILECCGKLLKWSRPKDYSGNINSKELKPFGIAYFDHHASALRCLNVLSKLSIFGHHLDVKVGQKNAEIIKGLVEEEEKKETIAESEDGSIPLTYTEKLDTAVREAIDVLLVEKINNKVEGEDGSGPKEEITEEDKVILSEIEQFRLRQQERDAELKKQRDKKIKEKMAEFQRKLDREKSQEGLAPAPQYVPGNVVVNNAITNEITNASINNNNNNSNNNNPSNNVGISTTIIGQTRQRDDEADKLLDADLEESRKRRKEVALRLMYGEDVDKKEAPEVVKTKIEIGSVKRQVSSKSFVDFEETVETTRQRPVISLDYSADDDNVNYTYNEQEEDNLDEEFGVTSKRPPASKAAAGGLPPGAGNIQAALELAKQQALNAAIAQSKAIEIAAKLASAATSVPTISAEERSRLRQKELVDQIPTEKSALFSFKVDWEYIERSDLINVIMKPWVSKKVIEYLEEEEVTLVNFILSKLRARCSPADLLGELQAVLDDEAEQFVVKLWRFLIFSFLTEKDNSLTNS